MSRRYSAIVLFVILGIFAVLRGNATVYTVKAAGGGSYTTIQACANAAVAGDTCMIYAGTYSGWTQPTNGSAGKPITFTANSGDVVTVTSGIDVSGRSYITISYLALKATITGDSTSSYITVDHNTDTTTIYNGPYVLSPATFTSTGVVISNNVITIASYTQNVNAVQLYGNNYRIENNTFSGSGQDCFDIGGSYNVIRGNYCHDLNGSSTGEHIDFVQNTGGACPTLTFSLIENNIERNCTNDAGNCHFVITRTNGGSGSCGYSDTLIIRYNYAQNLDGSGLDLGGIGDQVSNPHAYNNTFATQQQDVSNGSAITAYSDSTNPAGVKAVILNNILYETTASGWSPIAGANSTDIKLENGNLSYTPSATFTSPYSSEATFAALGSKNPNFANYPTDGTLSSGSPAIGAGVALTTVGSSDTGSGTSLVVNDARFFQPGWGNAQADWIRVGSTTTAQISAINYTTNTITLTNSITRSPGDSVYLYRDSNGRQVLTGAKPDVGAYPYGMASPTPPVAPAPPVLNGVVVPIG
jgi:hypothetical protein